MGSRLGFELGQRLDSWISFGSTFLRTIDRGIKPDNVDDSAFNERGVLFQQMILLYTTFLTRKLGPSSGMHPRFLNRLVYALTYACCYVEVLLCFAPKLF